jgi:protein-L-isoaspartate(D-aspartate) O-methyltransferase
MVSSQLTSPADRRQAILSDRVVHAMGVVPRHLFVPEHLRTQAYADRPLPIGDKQTISQPYIVARMLESLEISELDRVLDVGTGSGYQAALLYQLTPQVFSVEVRPALLVQASETLRKLGYHGVSLHLGDANLGWEEHAPYTRIIVGCAAKDLPPALWAQLAPGGRILIPLEDSEGDQALFAIEKKLDGSKISTRLSTVCFVPFIDSDEAGRVTN